MKGAAKQRRWPLEPLVELTGVGFREMQRIAPCNGEEWKLRKAEGVTERIADRLAVHFGYHPWEIWPDMADVAIEAVGVECPGCGETFTPARKGQRNCSAACRRKASARRRYADPDYAERRREQRRRYYAEAGDYERARQRRYDRARARARREAV